MSSVWPLWSEEKQQRLQQYLVGRWAEDDWPVVGRNENLQHFCFTCVSTSVNRELKYALWCKFNRKDWNEGRHFWEEIDALTHFCGWLNQLFPATRSLLEKPLGEWELSLRSYLVQIGRYRVRRSTQLNGRQEDVPRVAEDARIILFRNIYSTLEDAYDDREETEKDRWNTLKLGARNNPTRPPVHLNFTQILQPWLRDLAKTFSKYNLSIHCAEDSKNKLGALRAFSEFLAEKAPSTRIEQVNRALIVDYINYLRETIASEKQRYSLLQSLRTVFSVCAYHLGMEKLTKELIIFDDDLPKLEKIHPREFPSEVLEQLKQHMESLPTTILRMVVINLACGLRISELCSLPITCLFQDSKGRWYLQLYQFKGKKEHIIPLVDEIVVGTIQAQQEDIKKLSESECRYLFPGTKPQRPFQQSNFARHINKWAKEHNIRDQAGALYRVQSHQFRHTVAMGWLNEGVPLDVIKRLLNHSSITMTERYARKRESNIREELEKVQRLRKTVNAQGQTVLGDPRTETTDAQILRRGIRGQTLPLGGCGRLIVRGLCEHENKCLTCPFWLTSTEDLPGLKGFYAKALRVKQKAIEVNNLIVAQNQDRIIPHLALRIAALEDTNTDQTFSLATLVEQLRNELVELECALEESRAAGLAITEKRLEREISELQQRIHSLEELL